MTLKLAVIVPVYNEEASILSNIQYIYSKVIELKNCTLIVVNDGSTDNTKTKLLILKKNLKSKFNYVNLQINSGYGRAIKAGYLKAKKINCTHVLFMDSDLTNSPDDIYLFYNALEKYDYIKASRYESCGAMINVPFYRRVHSVIASYIVKLLIGKKYSDPTNGFRAIKVGLIPFELLLSDDFSIIMEELTLVARNSNIRSLNIPVILTNRANEARESAFIYDVKTYCRYLKPCFKVFLFRIGVIK